MMVLAIEPGVEDRLGLTHTARLARSANRVLGADGLWVTAAGLNIDYDQLFEASFHYAETARNQGVRS